MIAGVYTFGLLSNQGENAARMYAFVLLVVGNLVLIFSNRSRTLSILQSLRIPNKSLWWITGGALFFLALVLAIPPLRDIFHFAPLQRWEVALLALAALVCIMFAESTKLKALQKAIYRDDK